MRLSRRTNTIILWIISIGLLVGMIITFTPTMGLFGANDTNEGATALIVNGEPISELEVARVRQNPLFSRVTEGQVGEDLQLLLVDQLVRQEVFDQAAARTRVSGGEVRQEVENFREAQGVAGRSNDRAYVQLIGQSGFTDQTFRAYIEDQLRRAKYEETLIEDVEVSDAEVETFYLANSDQYRSEDRIRARIIVVSDAELAQELHSRAAAGEDFAQLATEHSEDRAERAGALGAPQGSTEPQPVGRAALPQAVSAAAFELRDGGLTESIEAGGRYYLVQVEEYLPEQTRPLAEVEEQVRADALEVKQAGVVQQHVEELMQQATVEIPEGSELEYDNEPVARVGDEAIPEADLVTATYTNQQIQQNLSPELSSLIVEFFKPTILETMIDRKLAYSGASQLDGNFVGNEAQVAQQALAYVSRDAAVSEEAIEEYYQANTRLFTVEARADATRVEFESQEAAEAFRSALLDGSQVDEAAEEHGGSLNELGTVTQGQLEEALDRALFATDAFEQLPQGEREVSDVLVISSPTEQEGSEETASPSDDPEGEEDAEAEGGEAEGAQAEGAEAGEDPAQAQTEETYVVLLAQRTPERVRPLAEVRDQVEQSVLEAERNEIQMQWLADLREEIEVVNLLAQESEGEVEVPAPVEGTDPDAAAAGERVEESADQGEAEVGAVEPEDDEGETQE